jgi:hypothetical protein
MKPRLEQETTEKAKETFQFTPVTIQTITTMKTTYKLNLLAAATACALAYSATSLVAQDSTNAVKTTKLDESPERPLYHPWTVGFETGTDGILGVFGSWRFSDHLGLGLGVDYTQVSVSRVGLAGIQYDVKLRLLSEPLVLDVYPWKKHSFHVGLGVMFNQNELTGTASYTGTIVIDGHSFSTAQVGSLSMKISQQPVNPYLTMGGNLLYFDRAHRWALAGELGIAYTGDMKVSLTRSGSDSRSIDDAVSNARHRLQDDANDYAWWPVAKLALTYSF